MYDPFLSRSIDETAGLSIFFVAHLDLITPIYGNRSLGFATVESGLMAGLLEHSIVDTSMGLCHIGGVDGERLCKALGLTSQAVLLHSMFMGRISTPSGEQCASATLAAQC